jgi:hypothetical protein
MVDKTRKVPPLSIAEQHALRAQPAYPTLPQPPVFRPVASGAIARMKRNADAVADAVAEFGGEAAQLAAKPVVVAGRLLLLENDLAAIGLGALATAFDEARDRHAEQLAALQEQHQVVLGVVADMSAIIAMQQQQIDEFKNQFNVQRVAELERKVSQELNEKIAMQVNASLAADPAMKHARGTATAIAEEEMEASEDSQDSNSRKSDHSSQDELSANISGELKGILSVLTGAKVGGGIDKKKLAKASEAVASTSRRATKKRARLHLRIEGSFEAARDSRVALAMFENHAGKAPKVTR